MGLFSKKTRSAVLIDIGSSSVGGAFMHVREGEPPVICYSVRNAVELHDDEDITLAMLRTLSDVTDRLVSEGGAALHREAGSAHIDMILASVAGPWQETSVRTVTIQEKHSFTFTRALMERVARAESPKPGRIVSDTSVIATVLNGYHTENPYGKHVSHAELTVLTSTLDRFAAREITKTVRKAFHSHHLELTAFAPTAFAVIADLYPMQKDFIVIDVSGTSTDAMIVKQGIISGVRSAPKGVHDLLEAGRNAARAASGTLMIDPLRNQTFAPRVAEAEAAWLEALKGILSGFAAEHPLPRAVFLLADEHAREFLRRLIDTSTLRTLWLSDESLAVIPLAPEHTARLVKARGMAEGDIFLSVLGIFYRDRLSGLKK